MNRIKRSHPFLFVGGVCVLVLAVAVARTCRKSVPAPSRTGTEKAGRFSWPSGIRAAVSITFDHSTGSQLDKGVPILDAHGIKATFYPDIPEMRKRLADWRRVMARGHEIGNHSLNHPCSGGFRFERKRGGKYSLENATVEWVEKDIMEANSELKSMLGTEPGTFSYPCGETFAGTGARSRSYVPVVAKHFLVGRGFGLDFSNNPADCDLAKVNALAADGYSFARFKAAIDGAIAGGYWVIFCGHSVGEKGGSYPAIEPAELEKVCSWLETHRREVWTGTVLEVGEYISRERRNLAERRGN